MAKETKEQKKETHEKFRREEREKKENKKTLRSIIIGIIIIAAATLIVILLSNSTGSFTYQGVNFDTVKFCDSGPPCLTLYKTFLPVRTNGNSTVVVKPADKNNIFNFYLRNDPRTLNVTFNGTVTFQKDMVFNTNSDFICNGEGGIAGANFVQLYSLLGVKVINDKNATCDPLGRYMYVMVQPGNKTSIEQFGPSCYNINIKGCEVLQGTEKFMIQTFVQVNKDLSQ